MKLDLHVMNPEKPSIGTVIWMHGLGSNYLKYAELVKEFWREEEIPLRFIFPKAPLRFVTINYYIPTRAWYDLYSITDLEREDKTGINASESAITQIIQDEINQGISPKQILLAGFSQGGAIALYTGLRQKHPIAGILALSCYLPLHQEHQEKAHPANLDTPIFMAHGTQDPICPYFAGKKTYEIISQTHANSQWREYEIGHDISPIEILDVRRWLRQVFLTRTIWKLRKMR
jgi:phospholipase/carboxylesterase